MCEQTIKSPVRAEPYPNDILIVESDDTTIAQCLDRDIANEIPAAHKQWLNLPVVEPQKDETYKCSEDCPYHGIMNDDDESPFCAINKASSEKVGPWGFYNLKPHPDCIAACKTKEVIK